MYTIEHFDTTSCFAYIYCITRTQTDVIPYFGSHKLFSVFFSLIVVFPLFFFSAGAVDDSTHCPFARDDVNSERKNFDHRKSHIISLCICTTCIILSCNVLTHEDGFGQSDSSIVLRDTSHLNR